MKEKIDISEWPYDRNQVSVLHELRFNEQKTIVKYVREFIKYLGENTKIIENHIKISSNSLLFSLIFFNYNDPYYFWKFIKSFHISELKEWALYEEQLLILNATNEYNFINETNNVEEFRPKFEEYTFENLITPLIKKILEIKTKILNKNENIKEELELHFDNIWNKIKWKTIEILKDNYFLLNNLFNMINAKKVLDFLNPLSRSKNDLNFYYELSMIELKDSIEEELTSAKNNAVIYKLLKDKIIPKLKKAAGNYINFLNKSLEEKNAKVLVNSNLFIDWDKKDKNPTLWQQVEDLPKISPSNCLIFKNLYHRYKIEIDNILAFLKISSLIAQKINYFNQKKDSNQFLVMATKDKKIQNLKITGIEIQINKLRNDYLSLITANIGMVIDEQEIIKFRTKTQTYFNKYNEIMNGLRSESQFNGELIIQMHKEYYPCWEKFVKVISDINIPKEILFPTSIMIKENDLISNSKNWSVQKRIDEIKKQLIDNNQKNYNALKKKPHQVEEPAINYEEVIEIKTTTPITPGVIFESKEKDPSNLTSKKVKAEETNDDYYKFNRKNKDRKKHVVTITNEKSKKPNNQNKKNFSKNSPKVNNSKKEQKHFSQTTNNIYNDDQLKLMNEVCSAYDQNINKPVVKKSLDQKISILNQKNPQWIYKIDKVIPPYVSKSSSITYASTLSLIVLNRSVGIDKGGRPAIKLAEKENKTLVWAGTSDESCQYDIVILSLNKETSFFIKNISWVANSEITGPYLLNGTEHSIGYEDLRNLWKLLVTSQQQSNLEDDTRKNLMNAYQAFINIITNTKDPMIYSLIKEFNNHQHNNLNDTTTDAMNEYYQNYISSNPNNSSLAELSFSDKTARDLNIKHMQLIKKQQQNCAKQISLNNSKGSKLLNEEENYLIPDH
ncbi:hypothetical protein [Spiroplasma eriocheiris]|uniref:Uncharacterized protein n=1 Tax=Spiroplasma eriocheiris TaxID=315358 RepID=A0A0H3XI94_9MOLU|nr:hypothetical protein [Spiroplasma eriocheiris]AHF57734.1 hypothetical protein SPE_0606 [Spiroplasma eriocheiris CCTCC M 207170]AKM54185.1 hypothetical protein SERIO_v1c06140 [Spiroplasma eriocheiris]